MASKLNGLFSGATTDALRGVVTAGKACSGALVEMMRAPIYGERPTVALTEVQDTAKVEGMPPRKVELGTMFGCPRGF